LQIKIIPDFYEFKGRENYEQKEIKVRDISQCFRKD